MIKQVLHLFKKNQIRHCAAVIVAAGQSSRMKGEDKILLQLDGISVIERSIRSFQESDMVDEIIVVTRKDLIGYMQSLCSARSFDKVHAITEGGESRIHSVMRGLDRVSKKTGFVAIHDGARPLVTAELINGVIEKAVTYHAAAPAVPVKDTIKAAHNHIVTDTPDRSSLFAVQTPQVFDYDLLRGALQQALAKNLPITDDCSAVEAMGMSVYLAAGSEENIKITTPMDVILAEAILKKRREA